MCLSRLHRVVTVDQPGTAVVEEVGGRRERVSLLPLDGPTPQPGEWLIVHAGYAIGRLDDDEAQLVLADLDAVRGAPPGSGP